MPSRSRRSSSATASCDPPVRFDREALTRSCGGTPPPQGGGRPGNHAAAAGFSLLEVVVALAILGISLGIIFQGIGQGLRLRGEAAENVRLALAAERLLGQLAEPKPAPAESATGEEGGVSWRLEYSEPQPAPAAPDSPGGAEKGHGAQLVTVRITVTAPSGRSWEMSTLLPVAEPAP